MSNSRGRRGPAGYNWRMFAGSGRSLSFLPLRDLLRERAAMGVFCELPSAESVEIAGIAGWDFLVIDCEHAPIPAAMLPHLVRAGAAAGIPTIVRVPSNEPAAIQHALDSGASGVQIPQIASLQDAEKAVAAARFHPAGMRGFNPFVRAADFSARPVAEFLERANRDVLLVLQIESAAGVAAIDWIVQLRGIDVLFVGPYDLSQSLGIPGETADPRVFEAGQRIVEKAAEKGIPVGCFTNSEEDAHRWLEIGVRYLCYSVDTVLLLRAMRAGLERLKTGPSQ